MTEQEVLSVIKSKIKDQMDMHGLSVGDYSDNDALRAMGGSCSSTAHIMTAIYGPQNQKTAKLRRYLDGMWERGLLIKHTVSGGFCSWWPVGFADELRQPEMASAAN